jgi:hypothetical protein
MKKVIIILFSILLFTSCAVKNELIFAKQTNEKLRIEIKEKDKLIKRQTELLDENTIKLSNLERELSKCLERKSE